VLLILLKALNMGMKMKMKEKEACDMTTLAVAMSL